MRAAFCDARIFVVWTLTSALTFLHIADSMKKRSDFTVLFFFFKDRLLARCPLVFLLRCLKSLRADAGARCASPKCRVPLVHCTPAYECNWVTHVACQEYFSELFRLENTKQHGCASEQHIALADATSHLLDWIRA